MSSSNLARTDVTADVRLFGVWDKQEDVSKVVQYDVVVGKAEYTG